MADLTFSNTIPVNAAFDQATGQVISLQVVSERVAFAASLAGRMAHAGVREQWTSDALACAGDATLPTAGSVAYERSFGAIPAPEGVHVDSRLRRIAQARAFAQLRTSAHQSAVFEATLRNPKQPQVGSPSERRAMTRRIRTFQRREQRDPINYTDLAAAPALAGTTLPLGAVDGQFAAWRHVDPTMALMSVKLPSCAAPTSRRDWSWVVLQITFRPHAIARLAAGWQVRKPTLEIVRDRPVMHVPFSTPKPDLADGDGRVLAIDWGVRRLMTAAICWPDEQGRPCTGGRPLFFDAAARQGHLARQRATGQRLSAKVARINRLLEGRPDAALARRRDQHQREADRVWSAYRRETRALAHLAARWVIESCRARGITRIAVEDLTTLEAGGLGRKNNERISQQIRGVLFDAIKQKAAEHSIHVQVVPARGTSSVCGCCDRPARHVPSPDRRGKGYAWLTCPCGHNTDRDVAAARHVGRRALTDPKDPSPPVLRRSRPQRAHQASCARACPVRVPRRVTRETAPGARRTASSTLPHQDRHATLTRADQAKLVRAHPVNARYPTHRAWGYGHSPVRLTDTIKHSPVREPSTTRTTRTGNRRRNATLQALGGATPSLPYTRVRAQLGCAAPITIVIDSAMASPQLQRQAETALTGAGPLPF